MTLFDRKRFRSTLTRPNPLTIAPPAATAVFPVNVESLSVAAFAEVSTTSPPPPPALFPLNVVCATVAGEANALSHTAPPGPVAEFAVAAVPPPNVELRITDGVELPGWRKAAPPPWPGLAVLLPKKLSLSSVTDEFQTMRTAPPSSPVGAVLFLKVSFRSVTIPMSVPVRIRLPGAPPSNVAPLPAPWIVYVKVGDCAGSVNDMPVHVPWSTVTVPPSETPLIAVWRFAQLTAPAGAAKASAAAQTASAANGAVRRWVRCGLKQGPARRGTDRPYPSGGGGCRPAVWAGEHILQVGCKSRRLGAHGKTQPRPRRRPRGADRQLPARLAARGRARRAPCSACAGRLLVGVPRPRALGTRRARHPFRARRRQGSVRGCARPP